MNKTPNLLHRFNEREQPEAFQLSGAISVLTLISSELFACVERQNAGGEK